MQHRKRTQNRQEQLLSIAPNGAGGGYSRCLGFLGFARKTTALVMVALLVVSCSKDGSHQDDAGSAPSALDTTALAEHRLVANPNTGRAGHLHRDTLVVALEVQAGGWYPEEENGRHETVLAFAEAGKAGRVPGPLLRVRLGVPISATIHNTRTADTLTVHGLGTSERRIPPGKTDTVVFLSATPGTFYYWASTNNSTLIERRALDSQLNGAIVVDSANTLTAKTDRVFVLSIWSVPADSTGPKPWVERTVMAINGKTWPYTERFEYAVGDTAHWRWINPTIDSHPMHLHGFYFNVLSRGDEHVDTVYQAPDRRAAVTELMSSGSTMSLQFTPTEPGHWLFHCHFTFHVSHFLSFDLVPDDVDAGGPEPTGHLHSMRGLVLGINVHDTSAAATVAQANVVAPVRQLRLVASHAAKRFGNEDGYAYTLGASSPTPLPLLSETIELKRGQPVAITVVNKLRQATAVHWHGIELKDSYVDGVPSWSGAVGKLAPAIAPNDSFVAQFTPPRAGTFIYHSHSNEEHQIGYGLYGALIVRDTTAASSALAEETFVLGSDGPNFNGGRVNGMLKPGPVSLKPGTTYRFRIVQMNPEMQLRISLKQGKSVLQWKLLAKDGAELPMHQQVSRDATVVMGPGETLDVAVTAAAMNDLKLEVASLAASWLTTVPLVVRDR
ncbi:MAG: multicopper oxidase domain-containing protein [Gemmatimonas sp.]